MQLPTGYSQDRNLTHILPSLAASLGADFSNSLNVPQATAAMLLMVDGLGLEQLHQFSAHAPFLRSMLKRQSDGETEMSAVYPATTAAGLSSLGTGLSPGAHGLVGYDVYDPDRETVINQLGGWDERTDPETWQPHPTIFQQLNTQRNAGEHHIEPVAVSLPAFEHSALTRASLGGPRFCGAENIAQRFNQAAIQARQPGALIYLYVNELDKAGHQYGPGSVQWLEVLEEIDSHARRLARKLPAGTFAALTADHGMIEVEAAHRIDFSQDTALVQHIAHTAGEPRMVQLHFDQYADADARANTLEAWQDRFGDRAWIVTRGQAIAAGWFGTVDERVLARLGDLIVTGHEPIALYDARRAAPQSFAMVGHHGAPTPAEVRVPWLVFHTP